MSGTLGPQPFVVIASVTMSKQDLQWFTSLTGVDFPVHRRMWTKPCQFAQEYITMNMIIRSDCVKALGMTVEYISCNKGSALIFANSKALTH